MDSTSTNAIAGPSNLRPSSPRSASPTHPILPSHPQPERIHLFLPPPGPPQSPVYITSTQDLLATFHLRDAYDTYVRQFIASSEDSTVANDRTGAVATSPIVVGQGGLPETVDKGKGKEILPQTPAADGQDGDDDEKGEKKKKNGYRHLIKGVPGKHSVKKDDYLTTIIQVPPKQRVRISEFDSRTQRDAFSVSLEGLKGWNPSALVLPSAQAREDKRKRKELRRLAKAQMQAQSQAPTQHSSPAATPIQAPVPTSATSSSFSNTVRPSGVSSTPKPIGPGTPRPLPAAVAPPIRTGSVKPGLQPVQIPGPGVRVSTPLRTATPTGPHPLSAPPLSASATFTVPPGGSFTGPQPPPSAVSTNTPRGKKREREDSLPVTTTNGNAIVNTNGNIPNVLPLPPKAIIGARAGTNGVRPRPIKKQRLDSQGVGRDTAPVQQHTPV